MINPKNEEGQREANRLKRLPTGGEGQTFKGGSKLPPYSGFFKQKLNLTRILSFFQDGHTGSFCLNSLETGRNLV